MRTYVGVAGLTLAGSVIVGAADPSAASQKRVIVAAAQNVLVADEQGARPDVSIRRLAVPEGHDVELGVSIRDLDPDRMAGSSGALVEDVRDDSPADRAGIEEGDVVTTFDGERVRGARHLSRLVAETPEGRTVPVTVLRGGSTVSLSVTPVASTMGTLEKKLIAPHPGVGIDPERFMFPKWRDHGSGAFEFFTAPDKARLGIRVQDLTPQLAQYFGASGGVLVASVEAGSAAERAGLKAGDVITAVNGRTVEDAGALIAQVREADAGSELSIEYLRDRRSATATATLPERDKPQARQFVRPV